MKHIFLLEDDETLGRGVAMALTGPEVSVTCRSTLAQAREALAEAAPRIADFAEREGLHGHARSAMSRTEEKGE